MNKIKFVVDILDRIIKVAGIIKTAAEALKKKEVEEAEES